MVAWSINEACWIEAEGGRKHIGYGLSFCGWSCWRIIVKCILIDDDEDEYMILQSHLSAGLNEDEYILDWFKSPEGAAQFACLGDYDVAFINHRIEAKSGLELLREIRFSCESLPVIVLSSWGFINNQAEFEAFGAAYIRKEEVTTELLIEKIRSVGVKI